MTQVTHPPLQIRIRRRHVLSAVGIVIALCLAALPQYLRAKRSARWPSTDGVITASWMNAVYSSRSRRTSYRAELEFRYYVESKEYRSKRRWLGNDGWASLEAWQPTLDQYRYGKTVKVYYDPNDPSVGVLEPGLYGEMKSVYKLDLIMIGGLSLAFVLLLLTYHDPEAEYSASLGERPGTGE